MTSEFGSATVSRRQFLVVAGGATGLALTAGHATLARADLATDTTWSGATTVFTDDCASLVTAGWARTRLLSNGTTRPASADSGYPLPGGYVMDHWHNGLHSGGGWATSGTSPAVANPWQTNPKGAFASTGRVPANTYHLYADGYAGVEQSYVVLSTDPATTPLDVGSGAWRVDYSLKINDLPIANDFRYTRGFLVQFVLNGFLHSFTLVDQNRLLAATSPGGIGYWRTLAMPDHTGFHDWSFIFDGVDTTLILVDGAAVGHFRGTNVPSLAAPQLKLWAHTQLGAVGTVDVEIGGVSVRSLDTGVAVGSIGDWTVANTGGATLTEDEGVLEFVAPAGGEATATRSVALGSEPWTFAFLGRILEQGANATVDVTAGGYWLRIRDDRSAVLLGSSATDVLQSFPAVVDVSDTATFAQWMLGVDAAGRFHLTHDGQALVSGGTGLGSSAAPSNTVRIAATAPGSGALSSEVTRVSLATDTTTAWYEPTVHLSIEPTASRSGIPIIAHLNDADPAELAAQGLHLSVTLSDPATDAQLVTWSSTPTTARTQHTVTGLPGSASTVNYRYALTRGIELLAEGDGTLRLPVSTTPVSAGTTLSLSAGQAALFAAIEESATSTGTPAGSAGWVLGTYTYDGASTGGTFIDSSATASAVTVPVTCGGWTAVYVGYVSGCESFTVALGSEQPRTIDIGLGQDYEPGELYGSRGLGEVCVGIGDYSGDRLTLGIVADKLARIAYVRFVALTTEEQSLAAQPNTPTAKAVHFNNDGYSGFYTGWYGSVEARPSGEPLAGHGLKPDVAGLYADSPEVSGLSFTSGTTLTRFDGGPVGEPYGGLDLTTGQPPGAAAFVKVNGVPKVLLRDGDKVALAAVLAYRQQGISPVAVVANHAAQLEGDGRLQEGFSTFSSLRMNVLYTQSTYPFMNGPYNQFPTWTNPRRQYVFDKWRAPHALQQGRLSYADPQFRTKILDQLEYEASLSPDLAGVELDFGRYPDAFGFGPSFQTAWNPLPTGGWLDSDLDPATGNIPIAGNPSLALDYKRRSVGLDLATSREVTTITLTGTGTSTRLVPADLRIWRSDTNDGDWVEVTGWSGTKTGAVITLTQGTSGDEVTTRFIKISHPYGDTAYTMANRLLDLLTVGPTLRAQPNVHLAYLADPHEVIAFRAQLITDLLTELRGRLGTKKIIARVPHGLTTLPGQPGPVRTALLYGYDVEAWVTAQPQPLVDILVPTNVSTETFWQGLDSWRDLVAGTSVKLFGGTSGTLGGVDPSKDDAEAQGRGFARASGHTGMDWIMYRERALEFYRAGFDGIYLFNAWNGIQSLGQNLGDPVALTKWDTFERPSMSRTALVTVDAVGQSTWGEVVLLVNELEQQGAVAAPDGTRLRGMANASDHAANANAKAKQRLYHQFNRAVERAETEGRVTPTTVRRLNASAYRAFHAR